MDNFEFTYECNVEGKHKRITEGGFKSKEEMNKKIEQVKKETTDFKLITNSYSNGCLKATNAINNKLMTAGIKIVNYDGSLSITKQGSKYKLIGAIKEQDLHEQGSVKGFDTYQEAADAVKKYGYKIRNSGPIKIGSRVIVNAGYHKNEPATVINMGEGGNNYRVQFDNGAVREAAKIGDRVRVQIPGLKDQEYKILRTIGKIDLAVESVKTKKEFIISRYQIIE